MMPLLDDEAVARFIATGYHVVVPDAADAALHVRAAAEIAELLEERPTVFDDHTLRERARPTPDDATPNSNDILRLLPAVTEVVESPAVRGALTSLCGRGYQYQAHRHVHFKQPGVVDAETPSSAPPPSFAGGMHQDGRFRALFGWNRFIRYPFLPLKCIAFYYPEGVADVKNGPTACVPGSHYFPELDEAMYAKAIALTCPPGSFVLLHSSLWHRGTPELAGKRRIMVKLNFDRTETPRSPSWDSAVGSSAAAAAAAGMGMGGEEPVWPDGVSSAESPWLSHVWRWMSGTTLASSPAAAAAAHPPAVRMERCFNALIREDPSGSPEDLLRAAFQLGALVSASPDGSSWVHRLVAALPEDVGELPVRPEGAPAGWCTAYTRWAVALAISAAGAHATRPLLEALAAHDRDAVASTAGAEAAADSSSSGGGGGGGGGAKKALLLDLLVDCAPSQETDPSGSVNEQRLGLFVANAGAKSAHLLRHFILTMSVLPRQARDKRRENSKRDAFFTGDPRQCDWVRHTAVQAMEACAQDISSSSASAASATSAAAAASSVGGPAVARKAVGVLLSLLRCVDGIPAEPNDFVLWNAISATRYVLEAQQQQQQQQPETLPSSSAAGPPLPPMQELCEVLEPLEAHPSPFVSWKAANTRRELSLWPAVIDNVEPQQALNANAARL
jgi:ectoine hydroxylase-related dioxygenase (phytanoyl-CoA dioxygenase family)